MLHDFIRDRDIEAVEEANRAVSSVTRDASLA
jgi:hypothetical protein